MFEADRLGEPRVAKDVEHAAVLGQHICIERPDTSLARHRGELLQETSADAVSLGRIGYGERDFSPIGNRRSKVVPRERHNLSHGLGDERHCRVSVGADE